MLQNKKYAIIYKEKVGSTNDYLKEMSRNNPEEKKEVFLIGGEQFKGRGQFDRSWLSIPNKGLYLSYLFYPGLEFLPHINSLVSIVLLRLLSEYDIKGYIKLPNDIYVADKKIAGILTESIIIGEEVKGVVIGIGLNLFYKRGEFEKRNIKGTSMFLESRSLIIKEEVEKFIIENLLKLKSKAIDEIEEELKKYKIID